MDFRVRNDSLPTVPYPGSAGQVFQLQTDLWDHVNAIGAAQGDYLQTPNVGWIARIGATVLGPALVPPPTVTDVLYFAAAGVEDGGPSPYPPPPAPSAGLLNNLNAARDPLPTDDSADGYTIGSRWHNAATKTFFTAYGVGIGVADWRQDGISGIKNNFAATGPPGVANGANEGYAKGSRWLSPTPAPGEFWELANAAAGAAQWVQAGATAPHPKDQLAGARAPLPTDDDTAGFTDGSRWVDISASPAEAYIAQTVATGATVWIPYDPSGIKHNFSGAGPPTPANADNEGYSPGSYWRDVPMDQLYVLHTVTAPGVAVWQPQHKIIEPLNNFDATRAPTVNDDLNAGYSPGSRWCNELTGEFWDLVDPAPGAAQWILSLSPTHVVQHNLTAAAPPSATDDSSTGYEVGSRWFDTTTRTYYELYDATAGAADWRPALPTPVKDNLAASTPPTANDDSTAGYQVGSRWYDATAGQYYDLADDTKGAAVWELSTAHQDELNATRDPLPTDDVAVGFTPGSRWYNTTTSTLFVASDTTNGAAVWRETTPAVVKHNLTATTDPVASNNAAEGYQNGSIWHNNATRQSFRLVDAFLGTWNAVNTARSFDNFSATTDPTATADSTFGYGIGSRWFNSTTGKYFELHDASVGAADWREAGTQEEGFLIPAPAHGITLVAPLNCAAGYVDRADGLFKLSSAAAVATGKEFYIIATPTPNTLRIMVSGTIVRLAHGLGLGLVYYVDIVPGAFVNTPPAAPNIVQMALTIPTSDHITLHDLLPQQETTTPAAATVQTLIEDGDRDTFIRVEQTPDEDTVRIVAEAEDKLILDKLGINFYNSEGGDGPSNWRFHNNGSFQFVPVAGSSAVPTIRLGNESPLVGENWLKFSKDITSTAAARLEIRQQGGNYQQMMCRVGRFTCFTGNTSLTSHFDVRNNGSIWAPGMRSGTIVDNVGLSATGELLRDTSSIVGKTNVLPYAFPVGSITALFSVPIVTYQDVGDENQLQHLGFLAEDFFDAGLLDLLVFKQTRPELNPDGDYEIVFDPLMPKTRENVQSINYRALCAYQMGLIQDLNTRVTALESAP